MSSKDLDAERLIVLIVDDEPDIRFLVAVTLEVAGYDVIEAAHGDAGFEQARSALPRVVITDRMMPVMGGSELVKRLRADETTAEIPIVMLTASPGQEPDADALLMKPFEPNELIELVNRLTGRAP
jgi:CheY-like chemotaxis protein